MSEATAIDYGSLVDVDRGTVDRRIFVDQAIYEAELKQIFARAWNFMCHESQIPSPGDYFVNYIGEDSVIATRDKQGRLQVFLNTCRHRGNPVCRAEMGNVRAFMCTYHGWTYDLEGQLIGVPGYKNFYEEDLHRADWGLVKAAKVESYKGFVFATMDPAAPDLEAFLGDVGRMGLNMVAAHGDVVVVDGIQKNRIGCNWKLAVDNVFDWYHPGTTHASAITTGYTGKVPWSAMDHVVALGEYGHAISGPRMTREMRQSYAEGEAGRPGPTDEAWRDQPKAQQELGTFGADQRGHPGIFPNLWVASSGTQLSLRLPRGPGCTEIWWFTLLDRNLPAAERQAAIQRSNHFFGPAGMFEQDDGENWDQATRACLGVSGREHPLNFSMNLGRGQIKRDGSSGVAHIDTHVNEHAQLWTYRAWAEWMAADSWAALQETHSIPAGVV